MTLNLTLNDALALLQAEARPDQLAAMATYGLTGTGRLGLSVPTLRRLARQVGRNHTLAGDLWATGIPDAQILAAFIADPRQVTPHQMDAWVVGIAAWDVCDQVCGVLFDKTPSAWAKVVAWAGREEEFVKRAAFSLLAALAVHDKQATDAQYLALLPVIRAGAGDERNYVKKAVSWALRSIGKRNAQLNRAALDEAEAIQQLGGKAARWVAADVLRELGSPAVQARIS